MPARLPPPYLSASDLAAIWRIPIGSVYRMASEDGWRRTRYRPVRYHMDDAHASYTKRRKATEMTPDEGRLVRELIDADEALREAMYNSDLEAAWAKETARYRAARQAVEALPGVPQTGHQQHAAH